MCDLFLTDTVADFVVEARGGAHDGHASVGVEQVEDAAGGHLAAADDEYMLVLDLPGEDQGAAALHLRVGFWHRGRERAEEAIGRSPVEIYGPGSQTRLRGRDDDMGDKNSLRVMSHEVTVVREPANLGAGLA